MVAAIGFWLFAAFMVMAAGTDIHMRFTAVAATGGTVCLGLSGVITSIDEFQKAIKANGAR